MRDKVILGATLSIVLLLTLLVYGAIDFQRTGTSQALAREEGVSRGRAIFAQYCIVCHGPKGEGCIGPALNREAWRPEINGAANAAFDTGSHDFIYKTLERGRAANQPGIQMPAWSISEGGSLNSAELEYLVQFINYGDWDTPLQYAASASGLEKDLPTEAGFDGGKATPRLQQVKATMLAKGCLNCHQVGAVGGKIAAPLTEVGDRRTADWMRRWIKNPSAMPADQRGPNLWVSVPKPSLDTPGPNSRPTAVPQLFPMNTTFMPTLPMTDDELNLLVNYLAQAKTLK